jgi:glycosyltransferase involved in cell wall biosynthesis
VNLKIAYICQSDPHDKNASGEIHNVFRELNNFGEVIFIASFTIKFYFHLRIINKISQLFFHKKYNFAYNLRNSKKIGKELTQRLGRDQFDIIFAPYGSRQIAFLETSIPIISIADATFQNLIDYYPDFSNLLWFSQREGNLIEQRAISKSSHLIYPSEWAANSAIRDYGASPDKVHIIHIGPCLDWIPPAAVERPNKKRAWNLLFVGRDWRRKGGGLAVAAMDHLAQSGLEAQLTIVGCQPPKVRSNIRVFPYLNKNRTEDARVLEKLYGEADFLILPTRADCSSVVVSEANAFGVPVMATQTGGLPSLIREGVNGYLLPLSAQGEDYARVISSVMGNEKTYNKLRQTSRQEYEKRLSWGAWSRKVSEIIEQALA